MRNTFFDRTMARGSRIALVGGLIGLLAVACSDKPADTTGDDPGSGGTDTSTGAGGDAQASGGSANPTTGTGGGQAGAGSTGAGGATGKAGAGGGWWNADAIVDAGPRVGPLKIMALGDSTTEYCCFRAELAKLLDKSHPKDYQFVGTRNRRLRRVRRLRVRQAQPGHERLPRQKTSGTMMNTQAEAPTWAALKPDVVLLHFATNDAWNSIAADQDSRGVDVSGRRVPQGEPARHDPGGPGHSARSRWTPMADSSCARLPRPTSRR